jgi:antitoxin YobK
MSADIVASAIATMAQHPDECWFAGPRDHDVVLAAEAALGLKFPEAYRLFATQLGAGSFGAQEILGVISDDFANSGIPDCVWKTLKDREELNLPRSMIVIYFDGGIDFFVLDTAESEDPSVRVWRPGISSAGDDLETIALSFGQFLFDIVKSELVAD